ncbi:TraR/DksA family transcriptional regulator [Actinocorallia populi]|uniref:TraR/DksA family transcriptional regulator n=1 Tax=Actinocorallia populi TaxID=2079200 RepID=UPI000D093E33|nr:TraR/DksA C4-type zinc finger protein [Actinocorallia populi]
MSTYASQDMPRPGRLDSGEARRRLEQERQNRLAQLTALLEGEDSGAGEIADVQLASIRRVVEDIDAALERLEAGAYGNCVRCSRPIPVERLEILPYARCCVGCQQKASR